MASRIFFFLQSNQNKFHYQKKISLEIAICHLNDAKREQLFIVVTTTAPRIADDFHESNLIVSVFRCLMMPFYEFAFFFRPSFELCQLKFTRDLEENN